MNLNYSHHQSTMEFLDAEDTAFYAQLTTQMLLLMDDDDETHTGRNTKLQGGSEFQRRPVCGSFKSGWLAGGGSLEVPGWLESLWASNGVGTGVFIPRAVATGKSRRRRPRKPRKNNRDGIIQYSPAGQKIHG